MTLETWLAFVAASLILTVTPGPSILLGMVHGLQFGARRTLLTALGDITANFLQMLVVACGLGLLVSHSVWAFQAIKWAGVLVLIHMGLRLWRAGPVAAPLDGPVPTGSEAGSGRPSKLFASGFLVAISNPKALVFFTAFFPQFLDADKAVLPQLAVLCPTMSVLDFTFVMLYALGARQAGRFLAARPYLINRCCGSALLAAAGLLAAK